MLSAAPDLAHVDTWIFDLDNTLYHPRAQLFAQIDTRMEQFIAERLDIDRAAARIVQKRFFHDHGTTLRGLMDTHGVEPSVFLDFVHDIDMSVLAADHRLAEALAALPGRRVIFTNADAAYAGRVLDRLGLGELFDVIHDIHAMQYRPKPEAASYVAMCRQHGIEPARALFVEDMARNLTPAKALGMTTVWIDNGSESGAYDADHNHIDIRVADLGDWLQQLREKAPA
jgi:putative hydrolase of the HAD superfamily